VVTFLKFERVLGFFSHLSRGSDVCAHAVTAMCCLHCRVFDEFVLIQ